MLHSSLKHRLAELHDSVKQTSQQIVRLSRPQPQPGLANVSTKTIVGNGVETFGENKGTGLVVSELAVDIRDSLKQEQQDLELLKQDVEDAIYSQDSESQSLKRTSDVIDGSYQTREHFSLTAACLKVEEDLKIAHVRFRKAQIQAKRTAELEVQKELFLYLNQLQVAGEISQTEDFKSSQGTSRSDPRVSLFAGRRGPARNASSQTNEDMLLTASSDLTSSLRRTHALLSSELSRSRFVHETLASSNTALEELNQRYGALDDVLAKSRGLLGSLLRSQKSDTWYLETAMYILVATVGWLLFRRLLYGPLCWFLWAPLKLLWTSLMFIFNGSSGKLNHKANVTALESSTALPKGSPIMPTGHPWSEAIVSGVSEAAAYRAPIDEADNETASLSPSVVDPANAEPTVGNHRNDDSTHSNSKKRTWTEYQQQDSDRDEL